MDMISPIQIKQLKRTHTHWHIKNNPFHMHAAVHIRATVRTWRRGEPPSQQELVTRFSSAYRSVARFIPSCSIYISCCLRSSDVSSRIFGTKRNGCRFKLFQHEFLLCTVNEKKKYLHMHTLESR
jgi:hypothetical protein